ncbi:MAG: LysR family transcriptional regulator [Nannocystales bacterium]
MNRLKVFVHVHEAGSAREAAVLLGVTQSAVSQSLGKLEAELGVALFVRQHRRLVRTAEGRRLYDVVAPFLAALSESLPELERTSGELVGTLRVGAPAELGAARLPAVFAAFRVEHPTVSFSLRLGHPSVLVPELADGGLDIAFVDEFDAPARRAGGIDAHGGLDEQLVLAGSPQVVAAAREGKDRFARLQAADFVTYHSRGPSVASWFQHHFQRVPGRIRRAVVVESVQAVVGSVLAGLGLGVVPYDAVAAAVERGELEVVRTRKRPLLNRISLLRLLDKRPSTLEQKFLATLPTQLRGYSRHSAGGL